MDKKICVFCENECDARCKVKAAGASALMKALDPGLAMLIMERTVFLEQLANLLAVND